MKEPWISLFENFRSMSFRNQMIWLSRLTYVVSMMARDTYEAGTDKVNKPILLRRYNELLHRISTQQLFVASDNTNRMPEELFFEMIAEEIANIGITEAVITHLERRGQVLR